MWYSLLFLLLLSCGSSPAPAPVSPTLLAWVQGPTHVDNSYMDLRDVDYEVHASIDNSWSDNTLVAYLSGWDNGVVVNSFNIELIERWLPDNGCYVTVRSVKDNIASSYGEPCWWEGS